MKQYDEKFLDIGTIQYIKKKKWTWITLCCGWTIM